MAKKFYVVWVGRKTGVFTDWPYTHQQVNHFPNAKYKAFPTKAEAEAAYAAGCGAPPPKAAAPKRQHTTAKAAIDTEVDVNIYCDGGCDPNPGKAGSGVAVYRQGQLDALWYGLYNPNGTNNTAELNALHESLQIGAKDMAQGKRVRIHCDSTYAINCVTVWAYNWKQKGWKRKTPGDIKNLDIIQQAHALYERLKAGIVISHVKAHTGVEGNELADRMSVYAITQQDPLFCEYAKALDVTTILSFKAG